MWLYEQLWRERTMNVTHVNELNGNGTHVNAMNEDVTLADELK